MPTSTLRPLGALSINSTFLLLTQWYHRFRIIPILSTEMIFFFISHLLGIASLYVLSKSASLAAATPIICPLPFCVMIGAARGFSCSISVGLCFVLLCLDQTTSAGLFDVRCSILFPISDRDILGTVEVYHLNEGRPA